MRIIAVMTPKGGVGKTTTVVSIAHLLAEEGKKVLIVDGDMQGDASRTLGVYDPDYYGTAKLLEAHVSFSEQEEQCTTEEQIQKSRIENIDVISGNEYLLRTSARLMLETENTNQTERMKMVLEEVQDNYDYCICDCAKFLDMVTINILAAADLMIIPIKCGGYEVNALENIMQDLGMLEQLNEKLEAKVLMTMWQKNKTAEQEKEWLINESGYDVIKTPIRRSVVVEKAAIANMAPTEFSKRGITAQDYREVLKEIIQKEEEG